MSIKNRLVSIFGIDALEFINHSKNYITADLFSTGLSFLSIPIITRLLPPEEYGIVSIFTSIILIFTVLFGLNTPGSVNRYYYEAKNDVKSFLISNLLFLLIFSIFSILIITLFFQNLLVSFFQVNYNIIFIGFIISVISAIIALYMAYLQAQKNSKIQATLSVLRNSLTLALAIILIIILNQNKYMGRLYAQLIITIVFGIYILVKLLKIDKYTFDWAHIRYSLIFGLPLMVHSLSGYILSSFDRVVISQLSGLKATGIYSFAYNVAILMSVIVMGMNKSWTPIFYEKYEKGEHDSLRALLVKYSNYTYLFAVVLILFSKELAMIMANKNYQMGLSIIPLIVLSYVFVFLYSIYGLFAFLKKKTILVSMNTLLAGFLNVGLNYWLIPIYGYMVAALTTLVSYIMLFVLHYINTKYILKENLFNVFSLLKNIYLVFLALLIFYMVEYKIEYYILGITIKVICVTIIAFILLKNKTKS